MINKNTILSTFDDRGTLLKWLKAVEKALKESVLVSVDVQQIDDSHANLIFRFQDGTTIESGTITLPRGERGTGFNSLVEFDFSRGNVMNVTADNTGIKFAYNSKVETEEEDFYVDSHFKIPIVGSDDIIVDVNEEENAVGLHLDATIMNKLARALLLPVVSPSEPSVVAVEAGNVQKLYKLGKGVQIENDTITAKRYFHRAVFSPQSNLTLTLEFTSNDPIPVTSTNYFTDQKFNPNGLGGTMQQGSNVYKFFVFGHDQTTILSVNWYIARISYSSTVTISPALPINWNITVTDNVIECLN